MKTETKNTALKVGALITGALMLTASGVLIGQRTVPETIVYKDVIKEVPVDKVVEVIKEVPVNVTVTKEVLVDNGKLGIAMEFIQDNIDEDVTLDYVVFETDAINLAEGYINSKMIELLDDNDFFDDGEVFEDFRKSEVSVKKISDVEIVSRDFEDKDVELEYVVKVKAKEGSDDSIYKEFKVVIPFEEGEMIEDDIEVTLI